MTDLTVFVTAHDETVVCGPAMRAADLAVEAARRDGFTVQTVVCLAAPTEATSAYFHQSHFDHWERRVVHERELGRVREALVPDGDGRYVAFLDADGLCSENWLAEAVAAMDAAADRGERVIAHPELKVVFDGQKTVLLNIDQGSPLFTPHFLYARAYYDSVCVAPREARLSYDDVQLTVETMAAGWQHIVVRDTIVFKRHRDLPFVGESDGRMPLVPALPAMAIDRIRDLGSARPEGRLSG